MTPANKVILDAVARLIGLDGKAPTVPEVCDATGIHETTVRGHLLMLQKEKRLTWIPRVPRSLVVLEPLGRCVCQTPAFPRHGELSARCDRWPQCVAGIPTTEINPSEVVAVVRQTGVAPSNADTADATEWTRALAEAFEDQRKALLMAARVFRDYEAMHKARSAANANPAAALEKAKVNAGHAAFLEGVLQRSWTKDPVPWFEARAETQQMTPAQKKILEFIAGFNARRSVSPTRAEIAEELGIGSLRTLDNHLTVLEGLGLLAVGRGRARTIKVTAAGHTQAGGPQ